jgi:hypothetical protein
MPLGIDPATTLRLTDAKEMQTLFGARGIAPCRTHAPNFVWSNQRVQHQTGYDSVISFEQAWSYYLSEKKDVFTYDIEGQQLSKTWDAMIAEAFQRLIKTPTGKTAIAVDNSFSEDQQYQLLKVSSQGYLSNVDLLWRPVAIALDFLSTYTNSGASEGMKLLIVDAESTHPEATLLELRLEDGHLVPLRKFYRDEDKLSCSWTSIKETQKLALQLADHDHKKAKILRGGEFLEHFAHFRDGDAISDTWIKINQRFECFEFTKPLAKLLEEKDPFGGLVAESRQRADEYDANLILWHGWPLRCREDLNELTDFVMPAGCVSRGAKVYAEQVEAKLPTYLELLPQLEIYSTNHKTNRPEFFTIIEEKEYPGGHRVAIDPINDFDIEKGIPSLPIILRRRDWGKVRKVEFDDLPEIEENAPITITGQLVPGQGHLKLRMQSREGRENLFGEKRYIDINWDTMDDYELPKESREKYAPDAYPVLGRVFDEDDPEIRTALQAAVNACSLDTIVNYHGHQVRFKKLLEPWGYNWPWGNERCGQSTRGLFSSGYKQDDEVDQLAEDLAKLVEELKPRFRHKFLNYMFVYTPESFKQELREIYSTPVNQLDPQDININTAYGVGRIFDQAKDVELFFKFLIHSSEEDSWPSFPSADYTRVYFWSAFRCLCYYQDTSRVNSALATQVCKRICNFLDRGGPNATEKKYSLCALLFMTRIRDHEPSFLDPADNLAERVVRTINKRAPNVRFPPAMGIDGNDGDNLSQFTIRFINKEVTDRDFAMLKGLVTSA